MVNIEKTIFKSLLFDSEYANKIVPFLKDEYFIDTYQTFFCVYKDLYDRYGNIPTLDALSVSLSKYSLGESEYETIADIVKYCVSKDPLPDTQWLIDETEEYCRDKAIYDAVYQSLNIIDGSDKKLDKFAIPELLEDALSISFNVDVGTDFFDDAEKRFEHYTADDTRLKFPLDALNILSNGGHKKKALSAFMAGVNVGKSAIMCYLAGEWLKMGKNVLYITCEMPEFDVYERIDANVLDVRTDDIKRLKKEEYLERVSKIKKKSMGKLVVKEYPTGTCTAQHVVQLCKELKQKRKFEADVILVDYLGICASYRYKSGSNVNSYTYQKAVAEEFRGAAMLLDTAMVTGYQFNRSGSTTEDPDMTDTSDSFGVPMSLDFFVAMVTNEVLTQNNQVILHLLKTRWGNKSKAKPQVVRVDYDKMRYYDVDTSFNNDNEPPVQQREVQPSKKREKFKIREKENITFND